MTVNDSIVRLLSDLLKMMSYGMIFIGQRMGLRGWVEGTEFLAFIPDFALQLLCEIRGKHG